MAIRGGLQLARENGRSQCSTIEVPRRAPPLCTASVRAERRPVHARVPDELPYRTHAHRCPHHHQWKVIINKGSPSNSQGDPRDGTLLEYPKPTTALQVVLQNPNHYMCHSESMHVDCMAPHVPESTAPLRRPNTSWEDHA
ncbi:hypothetical protein QJS10_CPB20g00032 [Acorus calamus]|uniref:Uncharacterized protein n=1 Tax=Acorus calamus TaxID=4465 RepID=A0AAV9C9W8_ACOCL|nr:hypothetical protein QJS10_CPB20g00032 [Acorus calamus]